MSIYIDSLQRALPRLLSGFNADSTSDLAGVGDRFHWGWKLIDFPNGTFQGAVHGLAILIKIAALPGSITEVELLRRMDLMIDGLRAVTAKNGSLDEALPGEGSFCVTALVVSDVLAAREILGDSLSKEQRDTWLEALRPLIGFLMKQDEHHGLISNHLASAALAMYRWHNATGDSKAESRGQMWLNRILDNQSSEGWFSEYGGADPGYQSWCTTQLAQLHLLRPDLDLGQPLSKSLSFLTYAAHPDGSFGGSYGWRNTRFLLPGGIALLAEVDSNATALEKFAQEGIKKNSFVTLDCMDAGNLVPFFNDYALAAFAKHAQKKNIETAVLPCYGNTGRKWFSEAGWFVDSGRTHYSLINFKRGGACVHFNQGKRSVDDPGTVVRDSQGRLLSTQVGGAISISDITTSDNELSSQFSLYRVKRPVPGPLDFIILRLMSITLFKSISLGNLIKKLLSKYLITRKSKPVGKVSRKYTLGQKFSLEDKLAGLSNVDTLKNIRHFSAIHMASQGYWQKNDDESDGDS